MEIVLREGKNELCIDHNEDTVGFTVLTEDDKQLDFIVDIKDWEQLKSFIDNSIWERKQIIKQQDGTN